MAVTARAQDLGNGIGYLYEVEPVTLRILSYDANTPDGLRNMRRNALINSPLATNRPAVGSITITACAAAGNLTGITINGVNQIAANVPITTSVPATEAAAWAAAVNAFTPGSGPDYTAMAIGDTVFIFSPPEDGAAVNGSVITVSLSVGSTTVTTTTLANGATNQGIYDTVTGRLYYINADYAGAADPTLLTGAVEITQYITNRGQQTGIPAFDLTLNNDSLSNVNRYNNKILLVVDTQGGAASDTLAQINAQDFIPGDEILIIGADPTHVINVESAPVAAGTAPSPNIYLAGDLPYAIDGVGKSLRLMFKYDDVFGPIFTESARTSGGLNGLTNYMAFFDTDQSITDSFMHFDPASNFITIPDIASDTKGTPALLVNATALLNLLTSSAGGTQYLLKHARNGSDVDMFQLIFTGNTAGGQYTFQGDIFLFIPTPTGYGSAVTGYTFITNGHIATGDNTNVGSAFLPANYSSVKGLVITGRDALLVDIKNDLAPGDLSDSPKMLFANKANFSPSIYQFELYARADNVTAPGAGRPTFVLNMKLFNLNTWTSYVVDKDLMKWDYFNDLCTLLQPLKVDQCAGVATMSLGTVTVASTKVKAGARILATHAAAPSAPGYLYTEQGSIVDNASFVLRSTNAADSGPVNWWITY